MIIKKFSIQNYRTCLDTTFELHPNLSVLIGPNSSGKTNTLCAILMLKKICESRGYHYRHEYKNIYEMTSSGECSIQALFSVDDIELKYQTFLRVLSDESNEEFVYTTMQKWYSWGLTKSRKNFSIPLKPTPDEYFVIKRIREIQQKRLMSGDIPIPLAIAIDKIFRNLLDMQYYSASQFTNPLKCPVSVEIEIQDDNIHKRDQFKLKGHSKLIYDIYKSAKADDSSRYDRFFDIIGPNGINLVDKLEFQEISTSIMEYRVRSGGKCHKRSISKKLVIPQFHMKNNILSPNQLSEGTFKTIALIFYLVTEPNKIMLIEEPEICVHQGLLSSILELIKEYSKEKQIIISTHSDFVLDKVKPENVFKVKWASKDGTKISNIEKLMSRKDLLALREYLENEGNLGEYWRSGGLE